MTEGTARPVAVLGFGAMGAGIAQVSAQAGHEVTVLDTDEERLSAGRARLTAFLDGGVRRGKLTAGQRDGVLARVHPTTDIARLAGSWLVIEAVVEDQQVKACLLARVAAVAGEDAIIASNTSALPVTALAAAVPGPERFAGLHFFNPAPLMPLVEVVRALQTGEDTVRELTGFATGIGKTPIIVADRPGFLVNRLLMPYLNDVVQAYDDGLATAGEIDEALKLGLGYPMGPLELLDLIGLDVHAHATTAAYEATRDRAFAPPPLLMRMVEAGYLGRKSGRGLRTGVEEE